jgi:hypothetical protein
MVKKIIIGIIIIIVFILLNIFSRFLYDQSWYSTYTFKKELEPYTIISLIVTTLVTLWLGWYVSKKITEQRFEKEFIISDLKKIEDEIKFLERSFSASAIDIQALLAILLQLNTYIDRYSNTVEIIGISSLLSTSSLKTCYRNLYMKTTNLDGNQLLLNDPIRVEITRECTTFICETRKLILIINKH